MSMLLLAVLACSSESVTEPTTDVRVDHAEKKVESTNPKSCVNEAGKAFVVWQDDRDDTSAIWFNMSGDGGATFLQNDTLLSHGEADAANPTIACAGDHVYVAWEDKRDGELGYENIYLQWSDDAGRHWQKNDIAIDADPEGAFISIAPALAAAGDRAWVVWADQVGGAFDIYASGTKNGGEEWSAPTRVDTDELGSAHSAHPEIAGDEDGNIVVVWEDRRSGLSDIYVNSSTNGGQTFLDDDRRLDGGDDPGTAESLEPQLVLSGEHAYVVWQDARFGENQDILMNYSHTTGAGWRDEALRVESDAEGIADSRYPTVAAEGERVIVAFQDNRAGGYDILVRWSENGGSDWANAEEERMEVDDPGESQSYYPRIAMSGDTWGVLWQDFRDDVEGVGFNDLYYNYTVTAGEAWQSADIRVNSTQNASSYAKDASFYIRNGVALTVWADGRFGSSDLFCAGRVLGEPSLWVEPEGK